jgi:hypothetical protein
MGVNNNSETLTAAELQYLITVQIDGLGPLGVYDNYSGGDATANPPKHRPGGMGPEISYLALPTFNDVTVGRVYDEGRDHELIATLRTLVGRVYGTVIEQPLDADGNPWGSPRTFRGRIASVKDGKTDSTSNAVRMYTIDFSIESVGN